MKSPAFQFYVQDFMVGTAHFSAEETGAYIRLLCYQWDNGSIENNEKIIKKITGVSVKKIEKVIKKFSVKDSFLKNIRLEKERKKQIELRKRRSDAGKKGNEIKYSSRKATANGSPSDGNANALQSSSSSSSSETTVVVGVNEMPFFEMFKRASGHHFTDEILVEETRKFMNKYPAAKGRGAASIINAWVNNMHERPAITNGRIKNSQIV